jgi:2-phospho-L-lactate/phosphoenolpyruvate guanylyltransferase
MTTAIVPLKGLAEAKSRLGAHLSASDRRVLVGWMLARVLEACARAAAVDDVLVLAGDSEAAALARRHGVRVRQQAAGGLQSALREADALLAGCPATLVLVADLPRCTAADLDAVAAASAEGVVVVPTTDGGTGALLRRPGGVIPAAFGPGSAAAHAALARRRGVPFRLCHLPGLQADLDTPAQLRAARAALPELAALLAARHPAATSEARVSRRGG